MIGKARLSYWNKNEPGCGEITLSLFVSLALPAIPGCPLSSPNAHNLSVLLPVCSLQTNGLKASVSSTCFILRCTILANIFILHRLMMPRQVSLYAKETCSVLLCFFLEHLSQNCESKGLPKNKGLSSNFSR